LRSRRILTRRLAPAAVALACALCLSACGEKQDVTSATTQTPFSVMLDWLPNPDHAALFAAIDRGYFKAAGLEVHAVTPSESAEPLKLLAAGKVDMAISYQPELMIARDQGLKLVSIAALVQRPLTSVIALPGQHVHSVADLAGKRVGTAGIPYQAAELKSALQSAGVSPAKVSEVNVGFDLVQSMLSKRVAATLGGFWNVEAVQLEAMHEHPLVIPVDQAGIPTYDELVLVVREDEARHRGAQLRAFLQALMHGEDDVRSDPAAAAKLIHGAAPEVQLKLQQRSIEKTIPATEPAGGKPFGWQTPSAWARFGAWMYERSLLKHNPNAAGLPPFTNEFLPGQGV
jgi:putative hydroxymethylpyrimidine transport system substrate-binding protein